MSSRALASFLNRWKSTSQILALARQGKRYFSAFRRQLYLDIWPDPRRAVFLASTTRSGSTWVARIINSGNEFRFVFEPFSPYRVPICHPFLQTQYLAPEAQRQDLRDVAERVLSGRVRSYWTDKYNRKILATKRLIKDVRANLFLKWLKNQFPEVPIVLLLRHPCAVAHSRMEKNFRPRLDELLVQETLVQDFLHPYMGRLLEARDEFEMHIWRWCIETYVPFQHFKPGEFHLAFYENFCLSPEDEIRRLFSFLGRSFEESMLRGVEDPSPETRPGSAILTGESLIGAWKRHISEQQVLQSLKILAHLGLDGIYNGNLVPDREVARSLLSG